MCSILNEYFILRSLPSELKKSVKYFHVISPAVHDNRRAYLVTEQDDFYTIFHQSTDNNVYLKVDDKVDLVKIAELCGRKVIQFFETMGRLNIFAKTMDKKVMAWNSQSSRLRPAQVPNTIMVKYFDIFRDSELVKISAFECNYYALDTMGRVYVFTESMECKQFSANGIDQFKYITSSLFTLAVSHNDRVYAFGGNVFDKLLVNEHGEVLLFQNIKIMKIEVGIFNIFVLNEQGHIYYSQGLVINERLEQIVSDVVFSDMFVDSIQLICQSNEGVFVYQFHKGLNRTKNINFFEYYLNENASTPQTIRLTEDGYIETLTFMVNENANSGGDYLVQSWRKVYHKPGYLAREFNFDKVIGSGGFGQVLKLNRKLDQDKHYALKMINIEKYADKHVVLREVRHMEYFDTAFTCELKDAWIECHNRFAFAHILMEYCPMTLRQVIDEKIKVLEQLPMVDLFVTIEILIELAECLEHVHAFEKQYLQPYNIKDLDRFIAKENKPLIHRDIKPENILMTDNQTNGRFVRLCDFGLISANDPAIQHSIAGTDQYMAPEVKAGVEYNHLADIYSFGLVTCCMLTELLLANSFGKNEHALFAQLIEATMAEDASKRPEAKTIVKFLRNIKINFDLESCLCIQSPFLLNFIMEKSSLNQQADIQPCSSSSTQQSSGNADYIKDLTRIFDSRIDPGTYMSWVIDGLGNPNDNRLMQVNEYMQTGQDSTLPGNDVLGATAHKYFSQMALDTSMYTVFASLVRDLFRNLMQFIKFDDNGMMLMDEDGFYTKFNEHDRNFNQINALKSNIFIHKLLDIIENDKEVTVEKRIQKQHGDFRTLANENFIITNKFQGISSMFEAITYAIGQPDNFAIILQYFTLQYYVKHRAQFKRYSVTLADKTDDYYFNLFKLLFTKQLYTLVQEAFAAVEDEFTKCTSTTLALQLVIQRRIWVAHDDNLDNFTEYCINPYTRDFQNKREIEKPIYLLHQGQIWYTLEQIDQDRNVVAQIKKPSEDHLRIFGDLMNQEESVQDIIWSTMATISNAKQENNDNAESSNYRDEDVD